MARGSERRGSSDCEAPAAEKRILRLARSTADAWGMAGRAISFPALRRQRCAATLAPVPGCPSAHTTSTVSLSICSPVSGPLHHYAVSSVKYAIALLQQVESSPLQAQRRRHFLDDCAVWMPPVWVLGAVRAMAGIGPGAIGAAPIVREAAILGQL